MSQTLEIPSRYCGPPGSGNGGYVAGRLAGHLGEGTVEVSLRLPPPLDTAMDVAAADHDDGVRLLYGDRVVAEARHGGSDPDPVEPVTLEEAQEGSTGFPGHRDHPFPGCFVCGPDREDGLRIFPGPVSPAPSGDVRMAAPWTPDPSLGDGTDADGTARAGLAAAWAALDCVGGWAGDLTERLMVLGRMTARVDALPVIGEPHVVVGRAVATEGRKTTTAATLWDADGRVVGTARHLWIAVDPGRFAAS